MKFLRLALLAFHLLLMGGGAIATESLFSDQRAFQVSDIITIRVVESTVADQSSDTRSSKSASFDASGGPGTGFFSSIPLFGVSAGGENRFDGNGQTSRSGRLSASITARVTEVLPSGDLLIEGSRVVAINQEEEIMEIQGIVRPKDIDADNTVLSTYLADARISYSGSGPLAQSSKQGFLSRFLGWIF